MLILFLILLRSVERADLPSPRRDVCGKECVGENKKHGKGRNVLERIRNMENQELPLQAPAEYHAPDCKGSRSPMQARVLGHLCSHEHQRKAHVTFYHLCTTACLRLRWPTQMISGLPSQTQRKSVLPSLILREHLFLLLSKSTAPP